MLGYSLYCYKDKIEVFTENYFKLSQDLILYGSLFVPHKRKILCRYNDIYVVITTYYVSITTYYVVIKTSVVCRYNEILFRYNDILSRYNNILSRYNNIRHMLL